ncbi:hypothetical protein FEZ62_13365 [Pseudomonas sp. MS19]|nr:hypothetical protein [Pseudomonas sp. MS19]
MISWRTPVDTNFDNLRAERLHAEPDFERYQPKSGNNFAGLWKQIALGIVVGFTTLSVLGFLASMLWMKLALGALQFQIPS